MRFLLIIIFIITTSCSSNKVVNSHGILSLEKKSKKIILNISNSNDIIEILGPPSTKSSFNDNTWIYIERKKTNQSIFKLGKKKIERNNVLVVQLDNRGILKKKDFYNLNKMNKVKFTKEITEKGYSKDTFVYSLLTSLREKINAPVRKRNKKK